jgi:hypothetical protein
MMVGYQRTVPAAGPRASMSICAEGSLSLKCRPFCTLIDLLLQQRFPYLTPRSSVTGRLGPINNITPQSRKSGVTASTWFKQTETRDSWGEHWVWEFA